MRMSCAKRCAQLTCGDVDLEPVGIVPTDEEDLLGDVRRADPVATARQFGRSKLGSVCIVAAATTNIDSNAIANAPPSTPARETTHAAATTVVRGTNAGIRLRERN